MQSRWKGECKMFMLSQVYTDHVYLAKERESDCGYKNLVLTLHFDFHSTQLGEMSHHTLYCHTWYCMHRGDPQRKSVPTNHA